MEETGRRAKDTAKSHAEGRSRQATIVVNPIARGVPRRFDGAKVVRYLEARGVTARLVVPGSPAEATAEARKSAERGEELLFVVGGDGSLRVAALGLLGSNTALAAVPAGTANVFARECGIPRGVRGAIDAHLGGQRVRMDLGRADGECFLLMAGIGWDAEVARHVPSWLKRRTGPAAYVLQGLWMLPRLRTRMVVWTTDAVRYESPLGVMVLSNTRSYGGVVSFAPGACATDGLLDMAALCPRRRGDGLRLSYRLLAKRLQVDARATTGQVAELAMETPGLAVQLDGDHAGETPMRFTVEPGALLVSVPSGRLPAVMSEEERG